MGRFKVAKKIARIYNLALMNFSGAADITNIRISMDVARMRLRGKSKDGSFYCQSSNEKVLFGHKYRFGSVEYSLYVFGRNS